MFGLRLTFVSSPFRFVPSQMDGDIRSSSSELSESEELAQPLGGTPKKQLKEKSLNNNSNGGSSSNKSASPKAVNGQQKRGD